MPTPTLEYFKRKRQTLLTDIGGGYYLNKMNNPKLPKKNTRLSEKEQEEEEKLKRELKVVCDHWKYWKFQIHWGKLKHVVPLKRDALFCMSSTNSSLKYVIQDNHWVGNSVIKQL